MRLDETINGYRIMTKPTNAGGGKCMWAFAEKTGRQYFVKQFLQPKLPSPDSGSERSRQIRQEACREFEERHRDVMKLLKPDVPGGGHLVLATDFFSHRNTFYKVTARVDVSSLDRPQDLDARQKAVLLKTLAVSLQLLHGFEIVHGDLKPENVLIQKHSASAFHMAKLIDFDDSYLAGRPPAPDEIAGDTVYGAPEWRRYVQGDGTAGPEDLTTAVDIFALGLMTHHYLTGSLPRYDARFGSPADAVDAGERLAPDPRLSDGLGNLITAMTQRAPRSRPRIAAFLSALKDPNVCSLRHRRPGTTATPGSGTASATSASTPSAPAPAGAGPTAEGRPASRLRTNLGGGPRTRRAAVPEATPAVKASAPETAPEPARDPETAPAARPADGRGPSRVRINLGGRRS